MSISVSAFLHLDSGKTVVVDGNTVVDAENYSILRAMYYGAGSLIGIKGGVEGRVLIVINQGATFPAAHYYDSEADQSDPENRLALESGAYSVAANGRIFLVYLMGYWREIK